MIDSAPATGTVFRPFEGIWLATIPSGAVICVRAIKNNLFIPYSLDGERKLTGHYYDCRVVGKTLFCRFEQFDSAVGGVVFLNPGPNETLKGGRWLNSKVPEAARQDISVLSESLPGMQPIVWVPIRRQTPTWAEKYFTEDWPNKPTI